ncbi:MAG: hypothetical protein ACRD0X_01435 [Thermoanaerobaculia bacterium]
MNPTLRLPALILGVALTAGLGAPRVAAAQWDFGVRGGVYTDESDAFVGVELLHRIGPPQWFFNPNVEWVFLERGDLVTLNADFHYDLLVDAPVDVWVGGGPAILFNNPDRGDDETDAGLNLLVGVGFLPGDAIRPYVQGKIVLSDETEAVLAFGVRF